MLDIIHAIKNIIERFIVNKVSLCDSVTSGSTTLSVTSARRFVVGDVIVVYYQPPGVDQPDAEVHVITEIPNNRTIYIDTPLVESYSASYSYVEKLIGFENGTETSLTAVYVGDPAVITRFPAITIAGQSLNSSWMTLESVKEEYQIDITVYVEAAHFETQMELMYTYEKAIRDSLFRSLYPLVEPYDSYTILEDLGSTDLQVKIDSNTLCSSGYGWIFLESADYTRPNKPVGFLGSGVYELSHYPGAPFPAGSKVIRPHRHIFNSLPASVQYGTVNKGTMLKAAKISYRCEEERRIYVPFLDPLTS